MGCAAMTAGDFTATWTQVELIWRAAAPAHSLDRGERVGNPKPQAADPKGEGFTLAKGGGKHVGGDCCSDVGKRAFFGCASKGQPNDLSAAYDQPAAATRGPGFPAPHVR